MEWEGSDSEDAEDTNFGCMVNVRLWLAIRGINAGYNLFKILTGPSPSHCCWRIAPAKSRTWEDTLSTATRPHRSAGSKTFQALDRASDREAEASCTSPADNIVHSQLCALSTERTDLSVTSVKADEPIPPSPYGERLGGHIGNPAFPRL